MREEDASVIELKSRERGPDAPASAPVQDIEADEASETLAYQRALRARLVELRQEHLDLAASIEALGAMPVPDQLTIARLKRRKLALKDEITRLDDEILPDIIA